MNEQHSSKSISFLMELMFVLLFFTIASAIAVFVLSNAKEKNDIAIYTKNAIFYGENLIEENSDTLSKNVFYLDENGEVSTSKDAYKVIIERKSVEGIQKQSCIMKIERNDTVLVSLSFLYDGGSAS